MTNVATLAEQGMERFGDYEALTYISLSGPDTTHRTGELHSTSHALSSALIDLGVKPGDRVAVVLPNVPQIGAIYGAITRIGAVAVPLLFLLAPNEFKHIFEDSSPTVVLTSHELAAQVLPTVGPDTRVICMGDPVPGTLAFGDVTAGRTDKVKVVDRDSSDLAILIYTGGTTGRPKGVMLTHGNLMFASDAAFTVATEENGLSADDISCSALPLSHSFGVLVWLVGQRMGGRGVLLRWFDPATWLRAVEEYGCTNSAMVPTMMGYVLNHPNAETANTATLNQVTSGAAALPADVAESFQARFGCTILEGWGLSESVGLGCVNRKESAKIGSIGRPMPGVEIELRSPDDGSKVEDGSAGELWMRGGHIMKGYWNLPAESAKAIEDGWLRTGDVGRKDADGRFYIVDRTKDLIIRAGFNIYPRDIEEVLHRHPDVVEAAVIGIPDDRVGEEVKAFVVLAEGAQTRIEDLDAHCKTELAPYKCPKHWQFLPSLPKSGVGKILRRDLREISNNS